MEPPPPHSSSLRLLRGDILFYPTGRPNIRVLMQQIRDLGYEVWDLHLNVPGFQQQQLPQAVWLQAIVLGRVILFIVNPAGSSSSRSSSSGLVSDQQSEISSEVADSGNVDPDAPEAGY